jgi:hypothetical protein
MKITFSRNHNGDPIVSVDGTVVDLAKNCEGWDYLVAHTILFGKQEVVMREGFRLVPVDSLRKLHLLIDPEPAVVDGTAYVFKNPMAADVLTKISAIVRDMLADIPSKHK